MTRSKLSGPGSRPCKQRPRSIGRYCPPYRLASGMRERRIDGCRQPTRISRKIENFIIQVLCNAGMTFFDKVVLSSRNR